MKGFKNRINLNYKNIKSNISPFIINIDFKSKKGKSYHSKFRISREVFEFIVGLDLD